MVQILMHIYTIIIFLSLFLPLTNCGMSFITPFSNLSYTQYYIIF